MENVERTISSVCGSLAMEGMIVQQSVRDSIRRCLRDEVIFDFAVIYIAGARSSYRSSYNVSVDEKDPYLYQYSCTLVNKLNIRDDELLMARIRDVSAIRLAECEKTPFIELPDMSLLKKLHMTVFGDIFSWAGEIRTTETDDPRFCRCEYIETSCLAIMDSLKNEEYLSNLEIDSFLKRLAHYICELHVIMPFRYGSDVAIREFANYLAMMNGFYLDYSKSCQSLMDIALKFSFSDEEQMASIIDSVIERY